MQLKPISNGWPASVKQVIYERRRDLARPVVFASAPDYMMTVATGTGDVATQKANPLLFSPPGEFNLITQFTLGYPLWELFNRF